LDKTDMQSPMHGFYQTCPLAQRKRFMLWIPGLSHQRWCARDDMPGLAVDLTGSGFQCIPTIYQLLTIGMQYILKGSPFHAPIHRNAMPCPTFILLSVTQLHLYTCLAQLYFPGRSWVLLGCSLGGTQGAPKDHPRTTQGAKGEGKTGQHAENAENTQKSTEKDRMS
jgi:hypothetical protein